MRIIAKGVNVLIFDIYIKREHPVGKNKES